MGTHSVMVFCDMKAFLSKHSHKQCAAVIKRAAASDWMLTKVESSSSSRTGLCVTERCYRGFSWPKNGETPFQIYYTHTCTHAHTLVQQEEWLACWWGRDGTDFSCFVCLGGASWRCNYFATLHRRIIKQFKHSCATCWNFFMKPFYSYSHSRAVVVHDTFNIYVQYFRAGHWKALFTGRKRNDALADILSFPLALLQSFESTKTAWQ